MRRRRRTQPLGPVAPDAAQDGHREPAPRRGRSRRQRWPPAPCSPPLHPPTNRWGRPIRGTGRQRPSASRRRQRPMLPARAGCRAAGRPAPSDRSRRRRPFRTGSPGAGARHCSPSAGRHLDAPLSPRRAEHGCCRQHQVVDHRLERSPPEQVVEHLLDGSEVISAGGNHERAGAVGFRRIRPDRTNREWRRLGDGGGRLGGGPALLYQSTHCSQARNRRFVVEAVATCRPAWVNHAIPPFPRTDEGHRDTATERGLLDRVHGLCTVSRG
jgi:hypothetical protein